MVKNRLLPVLAASTALVASPAFAAGTTAPDMTPISDAVISGVGQGITVLLALAPIVILFSVVWGVINKSRGMAK